MNIDLRLIQRRDIVIILIVLVLAQAIWGFSSPINLTDTSQLIIDLVLFTGYVYFARSLFRLPLALAFGITFAITNLSGAAEAVGFPLTYHELGRERGLLGYVAFLLRNALNVIKIPLVLLFVPLYVVGKFAEGARRVSADWSPEGSLFGVPNILGALDRAALIGFVGAAALPQFRPFIYPIGVLGLIFLLIIYVFRGSFSALVGDALSEDTERKE